MGYADGSYRRPVWIPIVGALVIGSIFFRPGCTAPGLTTPAAVEAALFKPPETGRLYKTIRQTHPAEFDRLLDTVVARARTGASQSDLDALIATFVTEAEKRLSPAIAQAPHSALKPMRIAEMKSYETLQQHDPRLCSAQLLRGSVPLGKSATPAGVAAMDMRIATWEAIAAGRDHPVGRALAPPSEAQIAQLQQTMEESGVSPQAIAAFYGVGVQALPMQEQCPTMIAFLKALETLPGEQGDKLYAYLLGNSGG